MRWGYGRVSSKGQRLYGMSLEDQLEKLLAQGIDQEHILLDTYTGTKIDRPKFNEVLSKLEPGDELVVCKLDRFARTAPEGAMLVRDLVERGIKVNILNMGVADNTPMGKVMVTVMLAFAEYERGMIVERTQTGKAVARQDPNFKDGRPKKFTAEQIELALSLLEQGKTYRQITQMTGISKSTLIRARNQGV